MKYFIFNDLPSKEERKIMHDYINHNFVNIYCGKIAIKKNRYETSDMCRLVFQDMQNNPEKIKLIDIYSVDEQDPIWDNLTSLKIKLFSLPLRKYISQNGKEYYSNPYNSFNVDLNINLHIKKISFLGIHKKGIIENKAKEMIAPFNFDGYEINSISSIVFYGLDNQNIIISGGKHSMINIRKVDRKISEFSDHIHFEIPA